MQVLLDSVKVAETSSGNIQASVVAAAGSHQLTVTATDANGSNARKSVGFAPAGANDSVAADERNGSCGAEIDLVVELGQMLGIE